MSKDSVGKQETNIRTLGGHLLIKFNKIDAQHFTDVWLCGPASFVFEGQITI
jgi:diaminopimelate epimerase